MLLVVFFYGSKTNQGIEGLLARVGTLHTRGGNPSFEGNNMTYRRNWRY